MADNISEAKDRLRLAGLKGPGALDTLRELLFGRVRPFQVLQVEVTSFCPASCVYCPHTTLAGRWKSRHMSAETFAALWPLLRESERAHLQGWGEPLAHPLFLDFAAAALRADCKVSTTSCGLYMTEELAGRLALSGIDLIAFSLAGADEASNASRRGAPFAKVREAIRLLQAAKKRVGRAGHAGPEIHLAYLALASQMDTLSRLPDLLEELDVRTAVVSGMDFIAAPELADEAFLPGQTEKIERARGLLAEASARAAENGREIYYSLPAPEARKGCLEHVNNCLYADAEGQISPCIYVNLPLAGDNPLRRVYAQAGRDDLLKAWHDEAYLDFRRGLYHGAPDANCLNCPKRFAVGNRE